MKKSLLPFLLLLNLCSTKAQQPNYNKIDLAEKSKLKSYLVSHISELSKLSGHYKDSDGMTIKSGKATIDLIGQNYITGVIKKISVKEFVICFLEVDEAPNLNEDWTQYSKIEPIAKLTVINNTGDLKIEWFGLYNRQTHKREYEQSDNDPFNNIKIFKRD